MPPLRDWILAVLLPFTSLEWCGGCWSRFTLPTFRTERERWGTPSFLVVWHFRTWSAAPSDRCLRTVQRFFVGSRAVPSASASSGWLQG